MSALVEWVAAGVAATGAGAVNAVAGGGTLITFPTLVALGVPDVSANVTNTVALCPGYLGGALAQRPALADQEQRIRRLGLAAGLGGLLGSILLVSTSDDLFSALVPFLILGATGLLALQDRLRGWLARRRPDGADPSGEPVALRVAVFASGVYGGFFGAGLGIMVLAVLGVALSDPLNRLNALKQVISLVVNVVAATFFLFSGKVFWGFAVAMAVGSLVGGHLGGAVAHRLDPRVLKRVVVAFGLVVGGLYLLR